MQSWSTFILPSALNTGRLSATRTENITTLPHNGAGIITAEGRFRMPHPLPSPIVAPGGSSIYYQGEPLQKGPMPALLYFALSGRTTLCEDPYNQPAVHLIKEGMRVFSWDLPFHGPDQDPHEAMRRWIAEFHESSSFIHDFMDLCAENLHYLIHQQLIDHRFIAAAGLSRGGYIAVQLAAREAHIKTVAGFAPLTSPQALQQERHEAAVSGDRTDLTALADRLIHKSLRFYIGNRDVRVGTDSCYSFVRALAENAYDKGVRSPSVELIIYPSIGFKGHGTPPSIFHDGAAWIKRHLIG